MPFFLSAKNYFNIPPEKIIDDHVCAKDLQQMLYGTWEASRRWQKLLTPSVKEAVFKSPSAKLGKWIHVQINDQYLRTTLKDNNSSLVIDWQPNCQKIISTIKHQTMKRSARNTLDDTDIVKLIKKERNGVIYIWAPEMPFSVQGIKEIQKSTTEVGVNLTILLSPVSDINFAKKIVRENKLDPIILKRHRSLELHNRGIDLHYPSLLTYKESKMNRYARHGYEPKEFFASYLKQEFSQ